MVSDAKLAIVSAVVLAVAAIVVFGTASDMDVDTTPESAGEINVVGTASKGTDPDTLVVRLGVTTEAETAKEALDKNAVQMDGVIGALLDSGVSEDDISTSQFNLRPIYRGHDDGIRYQETIVGYSVSNRVTVETMLLDAAADIIDRSVNAGANRVDSVQFMVSPEKHDEITRELVDAAVLDAKSRAQEILDPLGLVTADVKTVSTTSPSHFVGSMASMAFDESYSLASTRLFTSEVTITSSVYVTFLTETAP